MKQILAILAGLLMTVVVAPSGGAEEGGGGGGDSGGAEAGCTGSSWELQGQTFSYAQLRTTGSDVSAQPVATVPERWIFTTCSTFSLGAYTTADTATVSVFNNACAYPVCAANAGYEVWVADVRDSEGAFCVTSSSCQDSEFADTEVMKSGISVGFPNTLVITKNCGYASIYKDFDRDGEWSDHSPDALDYRCAPTRNYIGLAPVPL